MTTNKRLIVIEGVDCSGKTMYAKMLTEKFNAERTGDREWLYQHEPTFSSEVADSLNFKNRDGWQREYYFMKDRMNHQAILKANNVVMDRYVLTGLAYSTVFSPEVIPMMKSVYKNQAEFVYPDVVIFVDMDPINAVAINENRKDTEGYSPSLTLATLEKLRGAFLEHMATMREWEIPTLTIQPFFGDINRTFKLIVDMINRHPII